MRLKQAWFVFVAGAVVAVAAEAALPPDVKLSAQAWLGLEPQRQQDYAAGVADGLALGAFEPPERMRQLRLCMNGYAPPEIAALVARHGPPSAGPQSHAYAGAALIGRVMARECQLQWGPR